MKKIIFFLIPIIIIIPLLLIFNTKENSEKFYLESKYYKKGVVELKPVDFNTLISNKESFIVYVHVPGRCNMSVPFDPIVRKYSDTNNITIYSLNYKELQGTLLYDTIKYSPSVVIFKEGEIVDFLDPNSNRDLKYYESYNGFYSFIDIYIKTKMD